jgi:hypothetical protein
MKQHVLARILISVLAGSSLIWAVSSPSSAQPPAPPPHAFAFAPNSHPYGKSYEQWTARTSQWGMELPVGDCSAGGATPGHPYMDCPNYDVSEGQHGKVWYLPGAGDGITRTVTIPKGKALMCILAGAEASSLEAPDSGFYGATAEEQTAAAQYWGDHIALSSLFCELDGHALPNPGNYRFTSPQYSITVPTPWIFGATGGPGTSVNDNYAVIVKPLQEGQHVLHFGGSFHFSVAEGDPFDGDFGFDMTYNITQLGCGDGDDD